MSNTRYLGRKLDDSLPDFVTFVVSRFRKWGKRGVRQGMSADLSIKKPAEAGFFANCNLPEAETINAWRTADDGVLYADRLSYVQPDEHHG
ncbi:hypothetical protein E2R62_19760 [Citrobacter rodentium]|uniref:Uncharacterized protein n=1 Tax=Citrobacter rodentium TaxID=67825 RepID=A0A482PLF7_CITRO|nr:hypothetical protein E2R62_19760 [Citrobacter rodentium]